MLDEGSLVSMNAGSRDREARRLAREVATRAHAPYSRFRVGAVLEDWNGNLYAGCNVECASIGLSLCAERSALATALARGARAFTRLWIYTPTPRPTRPCGACREMLLRCAGNVTVTLLCDGRSTARIRSRDLLARPGRRGRANR